MAGVNLRIVAVMLGVCLGADGPQAHMPTPAESLRKLQHRLDALGPHFQGGSLARWSNDSDRQALQDVWDPSLLGTPPYAAKDVEALVTMLRAQESILRIYTNAGHAAPGSQKDARVRTKYQDEIVRSSAFLAKTSAALLQAIGDFAANLRSDQLTSERRQSLDEGRAGVRSLFDTIDTELQLPDVTSDNKMLLLDALATNAETIATYSPDEDRKALARSARAVLDKLHGTETAKLQLFIAAMSTSQCKGLCALRG